MSSIVKMGVAALLSAFIAIGAVVAFTPHDHKVEIIATYPTSPPDKVWALVTDHAAEPTWLAAFGEVTREADNAGRPVWTHVSADGRMAFTILTILAVPERRYERILLRDNQPRSQSWDGRWVIEFEPAGAGTRVRFTEYGWTGGFLWFLQQRYVLKPSDFPAYYLNQIAKALNDPADVEIIRRS